MEKGKSYLVIIRKKKQSIIREIECLEETKTCYKISFKSSIGNVFCLDLFDEKVEWILKTDFEDFDILEELPPKNSINVVDYEKINEITKHTTIKELFGDDEKKKTKSTKKKKEPISFQKSTEM